MRCPQPNLRGTIIRIQGENDSPDPHKRPEIRRMIGERAGLLQGVRHLVGRRNMYALQRADRGHPAIRQSINHNSRLLVFEKLSRSLTSAEEGRRPGQPWQRGVVVAAKTQFHPLANSSHHLGIVILFHTFHIASILSLFWSFHFAFFPS